MTFTKTNMEIHEMVMLSESIEDHVAFIKSQPQDFSIKSILTCPEPKYFYSDIHPVFTTVVQYDGDNILVHDSIHNTQIIIPVNSDSLKRIRHDYVYNLCQHDTDITLSRIATMNNHADTMTPDYISKENKLVIELGTQKSSNEASLKRTFDIKMHKYKSHIEERVSRNRITTGKGSRQDHGWFFSVLCVSPSVILSNTELPQSFVNELTLRQRIGLEFETKITNLLSINIFKDDDELTHQGKIIEHTFSSIVPTFDLPETFTKQGVRNLFTKEFYKKCVTPVPDMKAVESILRKASTEARSVVKESPSALASYYNSFKVNECNITSKKRIMNFPAVYIPYEENYISQSSVFGDVDIDQHNISVPDWLAQIWVSSVQAAINQEQTTEEYSRYLATDEDVTKEQLSAIRHINKESKLFSPILTFAQRTELGKRGVFGKSLSKTPEVVENRRTSKLSLHPHGDIEDIITFLDNQNELHNKEHIIDSSKNTLLSLLSAAKNVHKERAPAGSMLSVDLFTEAIYPSKLVQYSDMISNICQELSFAYKHNMKENTFMFKTLKHHNLMMIIRSTGSKGHVFCSFGWRKEHGTIFDTGKLGPEIYETNHYFITDFCSYNEVSLEHLVKSGPYMSALFSHLLDHFKLPMDKIFLDPQYLHDSTEVTIFRFWKTLKTMLLLFLSNKLGCEELITNQRYLFMTSLNEITSNPYGFTKRLPSVIRSRLEVYLIKQYERCMHFLYENRILKHIEQTEHGSNLQYLNIPSLFYDGFASLDQKINEFYFGYVISKQKGKASDRSFQITKKLVKFEYQYRKVQKNFNMALYDGLSHYEGHTYSYSLNAFFILHFRELLKARFGETYSQYLKAEAIETISKDDFQHLATLKASARDMTNVETMYDILLHSIDTEQMAKEVKLRNKRLFQRRPKVIQALTDLCEEYENSGSKENPRFLTHITDLIPYCLEQLEKRGYFTVDLFPKSQHGGDREIYVIEIMARILQYYVEKIARLICLKFPSETITHPSSKHRLILNHYAQGSGIFPNFCSLNKSGDASKWSQFHLVSKFCQMMIGLVDELFHAFLFNVFRLWYNKKICIPTNLFMSFLKNKNIEQSDEIWLRLRENFFKGEELCENKCDPMMTIHSGMMQGIFHLVSTLFHTMYNEVLRLIILAHAEITNSKIVVTILQGSDDSSMLIGINSSELKKMTKIIHFYHKFKDTLSKYLAIIPSEEKTAECTLDLVEYNSEWYFRTKVVKPTVRWVCASLETALVENFSSRYQLFSNLLTNCLEGGSSTYINALIQLSQAWLHYKMIGLDTHILSRDFFSRLLQSCDPSIGFFPLDPDCTSGFLGHDFNIYSLAKFSPYGDFLNSLKAVSNKSLQHPYFSERQTLMSNLRGTTIGFGKIDIWRTMLDSLGLGSYEEAIEKVTKEPLLLFGRNKTWSEDKITVLLKMYTPGVIASLSQYQPTIRMMIASVYMLSRPAFVDWITKQQEDQPKKCSLYMCTIRRAQLKKSPIGKELQIMFPLHEQYDEMISEIAHLTSTSSVVPADLSRKSKVKIEVFSNPNTDMYSIIDVVKRKWWKLSSIKTSESHFKVIWDMFQSKYLFLKPTFEETMQTLDMNVLELKQYLESLESKARNVTLTDSAAKYSQTFYNVLTRVYLPGCKLRSEQEDYYYGITNKLNTIRSKLFSILTFPFPLSTQLELVSRVIMNSDILQGKLPIDNKKLYLLKIFKDYLSGTNKEVLIDQIVKAKQGMLGYFNLPQKFVENHGRYGYGEWVGIFGSTIVKLNIIDNHVVKIILSNTTEIDYLQYALRQVLEELSLTLEEESNSQNVALRFDGKKISYSGRGIRLLEEPELNLPLLSELGNTTWRMVTSYSRIRLQALMQTSFGHYDYVSILSEEFNMFDFMPCVIREARFFECSPILNAWSNFKSCSTAEILSWLEPIISDPSIPVGFLLSTTTQFYKDEQIDQQKLRDWFYQYCGYSKLSSIADNSEEETDFQTGDTHEVPFGIKELISSIDVTVDIQITFPDTLDPLNLENLNTVESFLSSTEMQQIIQDIQENDEYSIEFLDQLRSTRKSMPLTHPIFFSFMNDVAVMSQLPFSDVLERVRNKEIFEVQGIIGRALTVLTGLNYIGNDIRTRGKPKGLTLDNSDSTKEMPSFDDIRTTTTYSKKFLLQVAEDTETVTSSRNDIEGMTYQELLNLKVTLQEELSQLTIQLNESTSHVVKHTINIAIAKKVLLLEMVKTQLWTKNAWDDKTTESIHEILLSLHPSLEAIAIVDSLNALYDFMWAKSELFNLKKEEDYSHELFLRLQHQQFLSELTSRYQLKKVVLSEKTLLTLLSFNPSSELVLSEAIIQCIKDTSLANTINYLPVLEFMANSESLDLKGRFIMSCFIDNRILIVRLKQDVK